MDKKCCSSDKKKEGCCACPCHNVKHVLMAGSFILLGAVGLWWNEYFMTLLFALLMLHGLMCLGSKFCKCC